MNPVRDQNLNNAYKSGKTTDAQARPISNGMKVLIAASIYPPDPGGPALHAKTHYEKFPEYGFKTELSALAHYRQYKPGVRHLLYLFNLLSKVRRCSVVYAYDAVGAGLPAWVAARLFGKKFIIRVGGDVPWERAGEKKNISLRDWYESGEYQNDRMYKISKFVLKRADRIIVTTNLLKDLYEKYYDVEAGKIIVILNPVERKVVNSSSSERSIIFASRLTSYKNLDTALRAIAPILKNDKNLKLVLMGDGPERENLEKVASNLEMEDQVEFAGHVSQEEVLRRTASCLFTLAPALTEFNPNYVLQGIGMGKPFIISWENGLPFEVPDYLRFNANSEQELRERISNLLSDKGYSQAREFVANLEVNISWDDNLCQNIEVIKGLL